MCEEWVCVGVWLSMFVCVCVQLGLILPAEIVVCEIKAQIVVNDNLCMSQETTICGVRYCKILHKLSSTTICAGTTICSATYWFYSECLLI